jgi:uncharacterized protein (DUF305 family)
MTVSRARWNTAILMILAGCSRATSGDSNASPAPAAAPASQAAAARAKAGKYPYTPADVEFMSHMIAHHSQALVMAGWAESHGASPSIRTLSGRIINGQQDEIATMQRWLRDRGQPVPDPKQPGMGAMHHTAGQGHGHEMLMPGMLTEAQMKELDQARGPEFDRLFLTYMIQHHKGAVTMVNQLFGTEGAAREETTFKLANDVSVDQTTEIARMQRMLAAIPPQSASP